METILGIDVGTKRVGVAIAEAGSLTARPLATFLRAKGGAENEILRLVSERQISKLVVGLPRLADGAESDQCKDVRKFVRRIQRRAAVQVIEWDEFGTSAEARDRLGQSGKQHRSERTKGEVDAMAAAILLDEYRASVRASAKNSA